MKAKGIFIATLLVVDTFFVAYAYGFHSRHVLVIDPTLPALAPAVVKVKVDAKKPIESQSIKSAKKANDIKNTKATAPSKKNTVNSVKSLSANKSKTAQP